MLVTTLFLLAALLTVPVLLFALYPPLLVALSRVAPFRGAPVHARPGTAGTGDPPPSFALVTVSDRHDERLQRKLAEFARLAEHPSNVGIVAGLDGGAPPDPPSAPPASTPVEWVCVTPPRGKNAVLGRIHAAARADVLVFSDVDARVERESLDALLAHFGEAAVGAVTGQRRIVDDTRFGEGQAGYSDLDSRIRRLEMRCFGSVTSCDGKLYAVRRSCIDALPEEVTDDLYTGLGAVAAGSRLVSEPAAVASIGRPARDVRHELERRRRVTCRGLATLWHRRDLLDPRRHGAYAAALLVNKLLRRLAVPCALLASVALIAGVLMVPNDGGSGATPGLVPLAVLAACAGLLLTIALLRGRAASLAYLALGTLGMTLGVVDYLRGRRVRRWVPRKQDAGAAAPNDDGRPALAYLVSHYPKLTETFVIDEVRGLERTFDVTVYPLSPGAAATSPDPLANPAGKVVREHPLAWSIVRDACRELGRSPISLLWPTFTLLRAAPRHPRVALKTLVLVPKVMAMAYRTRHRPVQHLHAGFANYAATMAWMVARLSGVPFSFVAHANDIFKNTFLLDEKVRHAAAVMAISRYNRDYLLKVCPGASAERIHVVPTGVDPGSYAFRLRPRPSPVCRLLSIGSLLEKKGHAVLLEAIAELRAAGHDVRCRIVGEGPERAALERRIVHLGLGDAIELVGEQSRGCVREMLDESDLFVLACVEASDRSADGIPVALMEAMASGLPVITTRLRAIPELVDDGTSGLLCEPGSAECIARSVLRLIEDGKLRDALAHGARSRIESDFDQHGISLARSIIIADAIAAKPQASPLTTVPEFDDGH